MFGKKQEESKLSGLELGKRRWLKKRQVDKNLKIVIKEKTTKEKSKTKADTKKYSNEKAVKGAIPAQFLKENCRKATD